MAKYTVPGLKLGCTSFVRPDGYVPGVRFAAECCEDVTILLFETGEDGACTVSAREIREIARIGAGEGTSFTVHLPADADFGTPGGAQRLVRGALAAVERTAPLHPRAFVLHVELPAYCESGSERRPAETAAPLEMERVTRALERIGAALPTPDSLALENLEGYSADFLEPWLEGTPWTRCFDIGHIWKDEFRAGGRAPELLLRPWLPRTRLCHLHGVRSDRGRLCDHTSLRFMTPAKLDAVLHPLWGAGFAGVITLEVFSVDNLKTSHQAMLESYARFARV